MTSARKMRANRANARQSTGPKSAALHAAHETRLAEKRGAIVRVCDPQGRRHGDALLPGVVWCDSALEAASGADVLVTVTEWNEFRALDLKAAKAAKAAMPWSTCAMCSRPRRPPASATRP